TGLKIYDWLAGRLSFGASRVLSKKEVENRLPNINHKNLAGGVEYFDGQFDDARLAINLAQTCADNSGVILNYFQVKKLIKQNGKISGLIALDMESKEEYSLQSKSIINATGVFVDDILKMDDPQSEPIIKPSQGVHIVVKQSFLNSQSALMIPKTSDGRVLFAVPWHDHTLVGTTDVPVTNHSLEPVAQNEEINFILENVKKYLANPPGTNDIISVFAGLRHLVINKKNIKSTKEISRDHKIIVSSSGLITITGGKWTTYRKMAEDVLKIINHSAKSSETSCKTKTLRIHGHTAEKNNDHLSIYGSDSKYINELLNKEPLLNKRLINYLPYLEAEVIWSIRNEMARTIEDVLARRLRILFLDATAAIIAAPRVGELLAAELNRNEEWLNDQLEEFNNVARHYLKRI
ncbi:MAG: glycerol-3-phosphate dehydrogenase/oxidase, partial [Flavisolibacter sp.]